MYQFSGLIKPTTEYNNKENKNDNNNKNECIPLHRYIHVRHIKQPQLILLKFFMLFLNSQTDLLDFMQLGKFFQISDPPEVH